MHPHRMLLSALTLFALASPAHAVPINVDFTALLDRPVNGSNTVTGSFWYESSLTTPFGSGVEFLGNYARTSASFEVGGLSYLFPVMKEPLSAGSSIATPHPSYGFGSNIFEGRDIFRYDAIFGMTPSGEITRAALYLWLEDPDANAFSKTPTMELPKLDLSLFPIHRIGIHLGDGSIFTGTVISMKVDGAEPVTVDPPPVPEPSTLIVLSVITLAGLARARLLRRQCR